MSSLTSPVNTATGSNGNSHPLVSPIRELVKKLPPRQHLEELLTSFFTERNWQYSISERWFRALCQKMWMHLEIRCTPSCRTQDGGCEACKEEINPHWLSLLFSVLALAPASGKAAKNSAGYFMAALTAKRLVEDILLASPVYSTSEGAVHGGVLGCIAAVFQAAYLGDRGRVSEAWKLIGRHVIIRLQQYSFTHDISSTVLCEVPRQWVCTAILGGRNGKPCTK
ncbi:hypothetical protein PHLCEN_2v907 [Hermanssonia centrifuga]|uniref:Uncharacterized protein n=1 Tax=Hermanssonia centrifuga TaxID=98765 RepID=A0A2R6S4X4_9APHY|nr:hypothetical protein PHLCEN_2v907 [Hermanssonia centrifuga]